MRLILIILFPFALSAQIPRDKQLHFAVGAGIGLWTSSATINKPAWQSLTWTIGTTTVIGTSKELIYDKWMGKGIPEVKDALWTIGGGIVSWGVVQGFKWLFSKIDKRRSWVLQ